MDSICLSYASALASVIKENKKNNKEIIEELIAISKAFDEEILKFLYSKVIKASDKKEVLKNSLKDVDEDVLAFLYVLIDNNRINLLNGIIEAYQLKDKENDGIITINVKSSKELNKEELIKLKKIILKKFFNDNLDKEIVINEIIDPSLLQGLVIEYQNKVLDASLIDKQVSLKEFLEK